jgi:hypothetical protein
VNNKRISRAFVDFAVHTCPHCGVNLCIGGSYDVFINNFPAHRLGHQVTEFCGSGISVTGSPDTFTNDEAYND